MSIGRDIALAREGLRVQAESLMRSTATVDRPTGRTTDPDTGAVVQSYEPRPPIVCHLLRTSTTDRTVVAGGADIAEAAQAAEEGGADPISLINTLTGMAIDIKKRRPVLGNIVGGLSGPAIMPVALRMVWQAAQAVKKIPVVGMGGITTGRDAVAFMLAGAQAVMVGTANIADPMTGPRILRELEDEARLQEIKSAKEWVGALKTS